MMMTLNDDIERLVARLESEVPEEEAYFAIFEISNETERSSIQANAHGLQRFAAELLKASLKVDEVLAKEEQSTIPIGPGESEWTHGDIFIDCIEPVAERPEVVVEPYEETWQDKAISFGCLALVLFIVFLTIVGVITVIRWIF